ncbi:MAG TPA: class I SAM-dependent methyltransferase [Streptosporangiaceae bacterium]|nr:class I SAM-dependent methyltransferase [Streptosporangiaceae bacterium]
MKGTPALVVRAVAAARRIGFPVTAADPGHGRGSASLPGTGRFLAVLAAGCQGGRIAELGTGAGIGSAWIASAMPADCTLVTAEIDPVRATAAAEVLAIDPRARVLVGDWRTLLPSLAPFDLIFADSGVRDHEEFGSLVGMLTPGGRIVMDDVTPELALPPDSPLRDHDRKRALFEAEDRLVWTEVVLPGLRDSLLVGTRTS